MAKAVFSCYKTEKGFFNYRLKAPNKETIAVSGGKGYASLSNCKGGIESVRNNVNSPVEDQTVEKIVKVNYPKYEIYKDNAGKFRFRLFAKNGELICTSESGYASKKGCSNGIESLTRWALDSDIVVEK